MRNDETGKSFDIHMMIDSGNTMYGIVISEKFRRQLGLSFSKLAKKQIQTARQGLSMSKMGITKPFSLEMEGIKKKFTVTATVIAELADNLNAGSAFLQWIGKYTGSNPNLTFHGKGMSLQIGRDKTELINTVRPPDSELGPDPQRGQTKESNRIHKREDHIGHRQVQIPLCAQEHLRLKPNTLNFIKTPEIKGTVLCEPIETDWECRALPAVY